MTDEHTDEHAAVRALLATVVDELPPTRLTVEGLCAAGRRRSRRLRAPALAWRPSRQLVVQVAAVLAAVVAVPGLVLAVLLTDRGGGSNSAAGGAAAPAAGLGAGRTYAMVRSVVQLDRDGRTLTVPAAGGGSCSGSPTLRAAETTAEVRLTVQVGPPPSPRSDQACQLNLVVASLSVRLDQPLGHRRVLDGTTGVVLPVLDTGKLARLTYLPTGYRRDRACTPPLPVGALPVGASTAELPLVVECTTSYSAGPAAAGIGLTVREIFGPRPPDANQEWSYDAPTTVPVHGTTGQLRLGRLPGKLPGQVWYQRELSWQEHGETIVLSVSMAERVDRLLPAAELLKVADGLRW